MHELSIAASIVDIAEDYARKEKAGVITKIEIEVGTLSGIVRESLEFAMEFAVKDTVLEKAKVEINDIPGKGECEQCHTVFEMNDLYTPCPKCNAFNPLIIQGKEMRVSSLYFD
jgi:hydrogenase nickel incorporation protein HypA/HybF